MPLQQAAITMQSATVVVSPVIDAEVSDVLSIPPLVTSHGSPVVMTPFQAAIKQQIWFPGSFVVGAPWVPLYRDQKTVKRVSVESWGESATSAHVPPLGVGIVTASPLLDSANKSRISFTAIPAGRTGVTAAVPAARPPDATNVGMAIRSRFGFPGGSGGGRSGGGRPGGGPGRPGGGPLPTV